MQYQDDGTKSRRRKVFFVSIAAGVLVLILGIFIVSAAMNSVKNKNNVAINTTKTSTTTKTTTTKNTSKDNSSKRTADNNTNVTSPVITTTPTPVAQTNNVPETGPADMAGTALLMGAATTLAINLVLDKRAKAEA
jgi:cytoskeletal protein RodZ